MSTPSKDGHAEHAGHAGSGHDGAEEGGTNPGAHGHDHDFDPEPPTELPPDEPRTPGYIPLVGLAIFVTGLVAVLVMQDPAPEAGPERPGAQAAPAAVQTAPVAPAASAPRIPPGIVRNPVRNIPPERLRELQKQLGTQGQKAPSPRPQAPADHPDHPGHADH